MVKNPNLQEADQLAAIYKRGRGVELGATEKQLLLAIRAGLEPAPLEPTRPRLSTKDVYKIDIFSSFIYHFVL